MHPFPIAALVVVAFFMAPIAAHGQSAGQCNSTDTMKKHLAAKYNERVVGHGLAHNGTTLEILASEDGKTWTLIFTTAESVSCALSTGENWENITDAFHEDASHEDFNDFND